MYRDILIVVEAVNLNESLLRLAPRIVANYVAELTVVVVDIVAPVVVPLAGFGGGGGAMLPPLPAETDKAEASQLLSDAKNKILGMLGDQNPLNEIRVISDTWLNIADKIATLARAVDLFVCFNPLAGDSDAFDRRIFEHVLHNGTCGIVIFPHSVKTVSHPQSIVVAWNQSVEASRAVRHAMPMLMKAREVTVLLVDPDLRQAGDDARPGDEIVIHLRRHDVNAKLARVASSHMGVAAAIEAELDSREVRMVVMGGYGKNAFADWLMGSVAREFLEKAEIPILMAV
jgi:nucleotide-binding universal stress UspA family protein